MDWLTIVNGLFGAGGLVVVALKLIEIFTSRNKAQAETVLNITQAATEIAEGGDKAVEAMKKVLAVYEIRFSEQETELAAVKDLNKSQRTKIESLEANMVTMQLEQTRRDLAFQRQIESQQKQLEAQRDYIGELVVTLRDNNIEAPPRPDILKESDPKIPRIK